MRLWLLLVVIALLGCSRQNSAAKKPTTTKQWLAHYAQLKLTSASENALLRDELFRIQAENALPLQFAAAKDADIASRDAAAALKAIASAPQLAYLDRRLAILFPQGEFLIPERHFSEIDRLADDYASLRKDLDRFSRAQAASLPLGFEEGALFAGYFIPCVEAALKLELVVAGKSLREGEWDSSVAGFHRVWSAIVILAAQPHLESRVLAAQQRSAALRLLELMLRSSRCQPSDVQTFRDLLAGTLSNWPPDAKVWQGERARALHYFEMIRDGNVLSIASQELLAAIDDHGGAKDFGRWLHSHVDADELYYLAAMRRLIQSCESPYHERRSVLQDLQSDLARLARTDADPLLSRIVLLGDDDAGMRWQASDRLHCEVMWLALNRSLGETASSDSPQRSPLTGKPYRVASQQRLIRVDGDSEIETLGLAVSTPRYDVTLAQKEAPEEPQPDKAPQKKRRSR